MTNGEFDSGAGGVLVAGVARTLSELTPADNILVSVRLAKPSWMETRFPVSLEDY